MWYVELGRHTDNEGDRLAPKAAADAGRSAGTGWTRPAPCSFSAGAARATQRLEILRHAAGQVDTPITAAKGLRFWVENRWRQWPRRRASERT